MAQLKSLKGTESISKDKTILIVNDDKSYNTGSALLNENYDVLYYPQGEAEHYDFEKISRGKKIISFLINNDKSREEFEIISRQCGSSVGNAHLIHHFKNRMDTYCLNHFIHQEENDIDEIVDFIDNNYDRYENRINDTIKQLSKDRSFACLGYNGDFYYFYKKGNQTIVSIKSVNIEAKFIKSLETQKYWNDKYSTAGKDMYTIIATELRKECEELGTYSEEERNRSVGFWRDGADFVYHDGESVYSAKHKKRKTLFEYSMDSDDKMVYTSSTKLNLKLGAAVNLDEKKVINDFIGAFRWRNPEHAKIAIGWSFISPLGGLLEWRPNIWIKGGTGSGKTTVSNALKSLCMVDLRFRNDGGTTEAGLRNRLNNTSFGAFLDEFESENKLGKQKKQDIALLVRLASNGGVVTHGVSNLGGSATYTIKNCFCMISIAVGLEQQADLNRFSILELDAEHRTCTLEEFKELERNFYCLVDPRNLNMGKHYNTDYCAFSPLRNKFVSKSFENIQKILRLTHNIKSVLVEKTDDVRFSDKMSPIIAGYAVFNDDEFKNKDELSKYIEKNFSQVIKEHEENVKTSSDGFQKAVLTTEVKFSKTKERFPTVGDIAELIEVYVKEEVYNRDRRDNGETTKSSLPAFQKELSETLKRKGLKISKNKITVNLENKFLSNELFIDQETLENELKIFVNKAYIEYKENISGINKRLDDDMQPIKPMSKGQFCLVRRKGFGGITVKTATLPLEEFIDLTSDED